MDKLHEKYYFGDILEDTYWGVPWEEFKNFLYKHGYEDIYIKEFMGERFFNDDFDLMVNMEEEIILINKRRGFLVHAVSWNNKKSISSANLYGEIKNEFLNPYRDDGVCEETDFNTTRFIVDCRENMLKNISKVGGRGLADSWVSPWNEFPDDIEFVNWVEEKMLMNASIEKKEEFYKLITDRKISQISLEYQQILGLDLSSKIERHGR